MCHSVCSLCASGRVKIKTTDEKQGNLITFSTVPILQSAAPKLRPIAIPTPLTDHPLNFTACCCISHHQHGCTQLFAASPWLIHAQWWTHWWMFTRQKCVYIQKMGSGNIWWVNILLKKLLTQNLLSYLLTPSCCQAPKSTINWLQKWFKWHYILNFLKLCDEHMLEHSLK